ncbi:MAG: glycoside hydrolase family 127 protein [Acidobacteria bacterium]|nr:glycoside hydrolase family 127 protein [Acidobacteriota bacterium]
MASPPGDVVEQARRTYLANPAVRVRPAFLPLPPGAVKVDGWLKDWALAASNGITGHLDEYSKTFGEAWKGFGFQARGAEKDGTGWPLEQSSYWLDGAIRLAWILDDQALKAKVSARLDRVVQGVLNGGETFVYWRPKSVLNANFNSWAHSHMGRALVAYYQATADPRVLAALVRVYRDFTPPDTTYQDVIGAVNADPMIDTFALSGNPEVLAHALSHTSTATYQAIRAQWGKGEVTPGHGVIFYENLRLPALFYPWTGNRSDLEATRGALAWHDRTQLLPLGVSSSEEYHAGIGATRNVETCNVAASMWTYLHLLRITGEGGFSDRIEKVFFNAGPAPVARDFQTMCYYQSPNRYSEANPAQEPQNPGAQSYRFTRIGHEVLCCVGNLNRVIPNYAMHMWMATLDGGLAAALYGPSMVRARVAGGVEARLEAKTN